MKLRHFGLSLLLGMMLLPVDALSAPSAAGKVRSVVGDVLRQKEKQKGWANLRVNANIYQTDKVRTGVESEVSFGLLDGSLITISENAEVEMTQLLEDNGQGAFRTRLDIKKGHLDFSVKKLTDKNSSFTFKTGTASAAIRGTEGFIGGEGVFFAALKNGKLEIKNDKSDAPVFIGGGETIFGRDSLVVLQLPSSGDSRFAKKLEDILADTTKSMETLVSEVTAADAEVQQEMSKVPTVQFLSYDSIRCEAKVALSDIADNGVSFIVSKDGSQLNSTKVSRDGQKTVALAAGIHSYEFTVKNQVGAASSQTKDLGCYKSKPFNIELFGSAKEKVVLPPNPPESGNSGISKSLQFKIRLSENDPQHLFSVTVKQNGKPILQEKLSQIQDLNYEIPVELQRGSNVRYDIEVVHKSGYVAKTKKVFEVSR